MQLYFQAVMYMLVLCCPIVGAQPVFGAAGVLSATELSRIAKLGPWPPAFSPDPSNRVSGQAQAIELGRRLFRDPRMSPIGYIACVTCHQPDRAFTDLRARAHGLADLPRNTPALANLRQQRWFGWGGASDSLWLASIRPMFDSREFDGNMTSVTRIFEREPELAACYRSVFGAEPERDAQQTVVNVGKALAAFQETLVTERTVFDDFRDASLRRDQKAMAQYPAPALRGLRLFVGQAGCVACHSGPNLSDGDFHAGASPQAARLPLDDQGRLDDLPRLRQHPLSLSGPYNDQPASVRADATHHLPAQLPPAGQFRTPGLRNVAVTAPFMHDGRFDDLGDALQHAWPARDGARTGRDSGPHAVADLAAFLTTLTDRHGLRRPWSTQATVACP